MGEEGVDLDGASAAVTFTRAFTVGTGQNLSIVRLERDS